MSDIGTFDVIVVGGRVAGSSCAIQMAREGLRVLLIEQWQKLPPTVSTHVLYPFGIDQLIQLGLEEDIQRAGFTKSMQTRIDLIGNGGITIDVPTLNTVNYMLCPSREWLDNKLLELAIAEKNITFLGNMRVKGVLMNSRKTIGVYGIHAGVQKRATADLVVGADGRNSIIAKSVEAKTIHRQTMKHSIYYGYYRGFDQGLQPTMEFLYDRGNVFYAFPMRDDLTCLTLNLRKQDDFVSNNGIHEYVTGLFRKGIFGERANLIELVGKVFGIKYSNHSLYIRQTSGSGWALIGDASMHTNPTLGQGIGLALRMADSLASAAVTAKRKFDDASKLTEAYSRWRNEAFWDLYLFSALITRSGRSNAKFPLTSTFRELVSSSPEVAQLTYAIMNQMITPTEYVKRLLFTAVLGLDSNEYRLALAKPSLKTRIGSPFVH